MDLKQILEDILPEEQHTLIQKIEKAINKELPQYFVAKDQYNKKVLELASTTAELKEAQATSSEGVAWREKYEAEAEAHVVTKAAHDAEKRGAELKTKAREELIKAGARVDIVDDFMLNTLDLTSDAYLDEAKEKYAKYFSTEPPVVAGVHIATPPAQVGGEGNPWKRGDSWSLQKQTEMFRKDPSSARRMASEAGIRL